MFSPFIAKIVMVWFMLELEIYYLWTGHTDFALKIEYYNIQGLNFPNPYGALWSLINPYYWNDFIYKAYLTGFVIAFAAVQFMLYKRGKLNFWIIIATNLQNSIWIWVTGYQHIIGTSVQSLAFWNPLFMIVWIFIQFPIGNPAGWNCDFGPDKLFYFLNNRYYQLCGPGITFGSMGLIIWHTMELAWFAVPMMYWGLKTLRFVWKKWK